MNRVAFFGVEIEIGPDALVPRAETELLAAAALQRLPERLDGRSGPTLIDVCCGTGNLACALAMRVPQLRGWAVDLTAGCAELARRNVDRLGLADRIAVLQGDLFAPLDGVTADLVVCNPPYLSSAKLAQRTDLAGEPREAFDGGPYGVTIHQRVAREAHRVLRAGGWLVCEIGLGQDKQVQRLLDRAGGYDRIDFATDATGAPRVVAARRSGDV